MSFYTFNSEAFFKKLLLTIPLFALPVMCGFAAFNYYSDPLSILAHSFKNYSWSERQIKSRYVEQNHDFDMVVFGSSKAAEIQLDKPENHDDFNFSFSAATPEEIRFFIEHFDFKANVILLGIDFFMFNEAYIPYKTQKEIKAGFGLYGPGDMYKYLFSFQTTFYALRDWWQDKQHIPRLYNERGARATRERERWDHQSPQDYKKSLENVRDRHFGNFKLTERRLEDLEAICSRYKGTRTKIILFINPHHEEVNKAAPPSLHLNDLRKRILSTCESSADFSKMDDERYFWRQDPVHYYPSTGDKIIRDLRNKFLF